MTCQDKTQIIETLSKTRPEMREEVLEDIMESESMTESPPNALFEIEPFTVTKDEYDNAIKGHS